MPARKKRPGSPEAAVVWERTEPVQRPAPPPLTRDAIVRAALALADREGLAAVSLRNVGAALNAGPMRLYGYISTKEELLELMVDAVYGELVAMGPVGREWREALRTVAHRMRDAARKHRWFIELLGGRPHLGPNALAFLEASLAPLRDAPGFEDIDAVLLASAAFNAYVTGALRNEASDLASGMDEAQWQTATGPYVHRMIATGRFPTLARVFEDATHADPDAAFDRGLDYLLDGIAAAHRTGQRGA